MRVEIDQSGKIENTSVPTILAFSNKINSTIFISAKVKRKCQYELRVKGRRGREIYLEIFIACLILLLKPFISKLKSVIIDKEYPGKDDQIRGKLLNSFPRLKSDKVFAIHFKEIGKHSNAHILAYEVYTGTLKADKNISFSQIMQIISPKIKKSDSVR